MDEQPDPYELCITLQWLHFLSGATALDLGACRLQIALAKAVLHGIHDGILLEKLQA